ncbi:MAG: hypothetical protein ACM3ZU_00370 [Bacteroidota bacterium]
MEPRSISELRQLAIGMLTQVVGNARVSAIAFQGGLGRGWVDTLSDVDLLLAFESEDLAREAPRGEFLIGGLKWSIYHVCFDKVQAARWKDKQRYVYAYETDILEDRDGRLAALCRAARLSDDEQTERIVYFVKKIGNRGITYGGIMDAEWLGIRWSDHPDLWVQRGDLYSAHMRLNQVTELLVNLVFAINGRPVPSAKWKHHLVRKLPWVPADLTPRLETLAMISGFSPSEFARRRDVATGLLNECVDEALRRGLLPADMGAYYFQRFSTHSDNTEHP